MIVRQEKESRSRALTARRGRGQASSRAEAQREAQAHSARKKDRVRAAHVDAMPFDKRYSKRGVREKGGPAASGRADRRAPAVARLVAAGHRDGATIQCTGATGARSVLHACHPI